MENLDNIIESILFVAGDAIPISDLCVKLDVSKSDINNAVKKLKEKYSDASGIQIMTFNEKLQLSSNPNYVEHIAAILNPIRQRNLTKATLETIAIVAYKQPITRTEIEETRGVNSDYAINILLEHKLIEIVGHKETVGKPALFGTTDEFLKRFEIENINQLPDYDDLMANIQRIRDSYSDSLFNRFEPVLQENAEEEVDRRLAEISKGHAPKHNDDFPSMDYFDNLGSGEETNSIKNDGDDGSKDNDLSSLDDLDRKLAEVSKNNNFTIDDNFKSNDVL